VKKYNRHLRQLIATGKAKPSFLVSHELLLDEAPDAYKHFDARDKGWTKVVLKPGAQAHKKRSSAASASGSKH
jgi:glutathione-independent formaldehyde dehydrogenase